MTEAAENIPEKIPPYCHDSACRYPEPHRHGFACDLTCGCGSGRQEAKAPPLAKDIPEALAALDFHIECAIVHMNQPCRRPATHTAEIHDCTNARGFTTVPICDYFVIASAAVRYPTHCQRCMTPMRAAEDYVRNVKPL